MELEIPEAFARRICDGYGQAGRAWLEGLPGLVETWARRWSLEVEGAFSLLSYNYVLRVRRADGGRAVLKLGVPNRELTSEMAALQFYAGRGCVEIYAADPEAGVFLIEELRPGRMLAELADDDLATQIGAEVMAAVWRPAPAEQGVFLSVAGWAEGIGRYQARYGRNGPLEARLVEQAGGLFRELLASAGPATLLHGDLHHYNILEAERAPWLVIDPKGVIGEPAYELGAFLYNPQPDFSRRSDLGQRLRRRIDLLCERLGLERARVVGYGVAQAVLSACWSLEDNEGGWEGVMRVAEVLSDFE